VITKTYVTIGLTEPSLSAPESEVVRRNSVPNIKRKVLASITAASVLIIGAPLTAQAAPPPVHTQTSSLAAPASGAERVFTFSESAGLVLNAPHGSLNPSSLGESVVRASLANRQLQISTEPTSIATSQDIVPSRTSQTAGLSNVIGRIILVPPSFRHPVEVVRHGGVAFALGGLEIWLDEHATTILIKGLFAGSGAAWVTAEFHCMDGSWRIVGWRCCLDTGSRRGRRWAVRLQR
jgi:hypothetical protein